MGYIDFHAHLAASEQARERLLGSMDACDIDRAVVVAGGVVAPQTLASHFAYGGGINQSADNEAVFALCERSEGRLLPFYFANPYDETSAYRANGHRFYGLKLAPIVHGVPFLDARVTKLFDEAGAFGHSVYVHCLPRAGFQVQDLVRAAAEFPKLPIVLGHAGVCHCDYLGVDQIAPLSNLYLETSGAFSGLVRYAMEKLGEERVLFGTEFPLQDPSVEIAKAKAVGLTPERTTRNAERLIRLGEWHG